MPDDEPLALSRQMAKHTDRIGEQPFVAVDKKST